MKLLAFTDLDHSLLTADYSYKNALPALARLKKNNIPLILTTSKTKDEIINLRKEMKLLYPFIAENGAAIFFDKRHFPGKEIDIENLESFFSGKPYQEIINVLESIRNKKGFKFSGFNDMTTAEIIKYTGLKKNQAERAKNRSASEPLVWKDTTEKLNTFTELMKSENLQVIKGGRFYHVKGAFDKGAAMLWIIEKYQKYTRDKVKTIALGDSPNDLSMLQNSDWPVVIPHKDEDHRLKLKHPNVYYAKSVADSGWNEAINFIFTKIERIS